MDNDSAKRVRRYVGGVLDGGIISCRLVKLAVGRYCHDLETAEERGLYFDLNDASAAVEFYPLLRQSKGQWAGKPFVLSDWESFIIWNIFGWKRKATGKRRFTKSYAEVPRKNGKSTLGAGTGLLLLIGDEEAGAEIYSSATRRDQAKIVFEEAKAMVKGTPELKGALEVYQNAIAWPEKRCKFEPLARSDKSSDGLNPHGNIIDELHAHVDRTFFDVLTTGSGAREQPLDFIITTAGQGEGTICKEMHDYAVTVLESYKDPAYSDNNLFTYIASLDWDDGDDWTDETLWKKANPNLGVSLSAEYLRRQVTEARISPARKNAVLRLHFNKWVSASARAIEANDWDACPSEINYDELKGRACFGGLDLAKVDDLSALALVFPAPDGSAKALCKFYCPGDDIAARARGGVPYDVWREQGLITATPGNTTDYDFIQADVMEMSAAYDIRGIAFDRMFAAPLVNRLMDNGIEMVPFGQGFYSMAAPVAEVLRLIKSRQLNHGGNPVLRWNALNAVTVADPAGSLKFDKGKSAEKIDGLVALTMAAGMCIGKVETLESVYENRGALLI